MVAVCLVGCAPATIDFTTEPPVPEPPGVERSAEVRALDALVDSIAGYGSPRAYAVEHPRDYEDAVHTRFFMAASGACQGRDVNEVGLRSTARERATGKIRRLTLAWSGTQGSVFVTSHESYHYDGEGRLGVVVIDREEDHVLDEAFMRSMREHNERIAAEQASMPKETEAERIAAAHKQRLLRDSLTITQERLYFGRDGAVIFETRREGLERARAAEFADLDLLPPVLYGTVFPANVTSEPVLTALTPLPRYTMRPLPERVIDPAASLRATLVAADPHDPEASLAATPRCR